MPEMWEKFLDWLVTYPRDPATQVAWADQNGVHEDSLRRIKRDRRFVEEWEKRAAQTNASVEKVNSVIAAIYQAAERGDVKAATLYLQYVDRFTPKRAVQIDQRQEVRGLTDEELAEALRAEAS